MSLPAEKSPELDKFIAEFYQIMNELKPVLLKLVHKIKKNGMLLN
jgi:hypothetical protein